MQQFSAMLWCEKKMDPPGVLAMSFESELLQQQERLFRFALTICRNPDTAKDLVQTTCEKALTYQGSFKPETNFKAWLFTILRNTYRSEYRKRQREVPDPDGTIAGRVEVAPDQFEHVVLAETLKHMDTLPPQWHQPLILALEEVSYDEMAKELGAPTGTIKSRLNRARTKLKERTGYE